MAFNGIGTNLVVYIRSILHGGIASSASTVSFWYGTSFFVPILGATIADTYWGNYKTVLISLIMYLLVRLISPWSLALLTHISVFIFPFVTSFLIAKP
jgi:dipeptide/tripeptide permease